MGAPVCHVPTDQTIIEQPQPVLLPSIPVATDLKSALIALAALKIIVQALAGQQSTFGAAGINGLAGMRGQAGVAGGDGSQGRPGSPGKAGKAGKDAKPPRYVEDRSQRVVKSVTIESDDGESKVTFDRTDRFVLVDQVTGNTIVWSR